MMHRMKKETKSRLNQLVPTIFNVCALIIIMVFICCDEGSEEDVMEEVVIEEETVEEEPSVIFPFDVGLTSWKITLPRNFSGRTRDGVLVADEVFLDASRNHYDQDPSFEVYQDAYFYLTDEDYVRFECPATDEIPTTSINTTNTRTELREMPSNGGSEAGWDATNATIKTLEFRVRILQTPTSKKLAFAQIHDFQQPIWDDLIRVQVESEQSNATIGASGRIYIMGDMVEGEIEDGFDIDFRDLNYANRVIKDNYVLGDWLHVKITVQNSTIAIFLDDMQNSIRVYENATCISNYFKAGVYNQSISSNYGGVGIAEFSEIIVSDNF